LELRGLVIGQAVEALRGYHMGMWFPSAAELERVVEFYSFPVEFQDFKQNFV